MGRRSAEWGGPFKRVCYALVQDVTPGEREAAPGLWVSLDGMTLELGYPEV